MARSKFILLGLIFLLSGCKGVGPFPAKKIWEHINGKRGCTYYPVIKDDPLTVGDGVDLPMEQCPASISGFDYQDVPDVMNWIRKAQSEAKAHCK